MFEYIFLVLILVNGSIHGTVTVQTKSAEMCELLQQSMVEDSEHIPPTAAIQTTVGPCTKRADA